MYTTDEMFEDPNEWGSFHDICTYALLPEDPDIRMDKDLVRECWEHLPVEIRNIAHSWGMSDTVFRDKAFTYMQEQSLVEEG